MTTGPDLLVVAYQGLAAPEQDEAFERIHQLRVDREAGEESEMARYLRSLRAVADHVGRTPTSDDYREAAPEMKAAGIEVEPFSKVWRFFGSWPRAREALDLSAAGTTTRRIEARFRSRALGKVWRYDDDDLRDALQRATEAVGHPPSTAEFDWWRQRELELAAASGQRDMHLPSVGPYRQRWGTWEQALLAHGYEEAEVSRRLTAKNNIIRRDFDPDAGLPEDLPEAVLLENVEAAGLAHDAIARLRTGWQALPRRSRYALTVRLGLGGAEKLTAAKAALVLGLTPSRIYQLQAETLDQLADVGGLPGRDAAAQALKQLSQTDA